MKTIVLGLALLVGAAGLATGLSVTATDNRVFFIGEDMDGKIIIEEINLDNNAACGGFAPLVEDCSTGSHLNRGGISHGFAARPNCGAGTGAPALPAQVGKCYLGAATSQLVHPTGARTFVCQINEMPAVPASTGLNTISCSGSGTFPSTGATFTHNCFSDDQGTPGAGNSGSGLGSWGCSITHS